MSEILKACPFCGKIPKPSWIDESYMECTNRKCHIYSYGMSTGAWNTRPIEDELQARIIEVTNLYLQTKDAFDVAIEILLKQDARIAELEAAQRWRVVANGELPEEDGEYWVWFDDEFTGIKISGYCDYSKQNGWDNTERVTHWMPLPPNPESPNDTQSSTIVYGKEGEE